jgi:3-oxo-5-alpha-steroid 4-dehydrogenase 1
MSWYTGDATYDTVLAVALAMALLVALVAPFVPSPYGRFASERFGLAVDPRLGWFLMELPATVTFLYAYGRGPHRFEAVPLVFLAVWLVHYGNRGVFFPLSIRTPRGAKSSFSVMVVAIGWGVTLVHGYLNGAFLSTWGTHLSSGWLSDPRFIAGIVVYAVSLALNIHSDAIVRGLRTREEMEAGQKVYRIPRGGLFRWVSSPSYLTELCAWAGFALSTWSLAGVFILVVSTANLAPRALSTHRWYRERFPDYPANRKALIPFLL